MESEKENQKNPETKPVSELRFDIVSKDWIVIATGRARRPETFVREKRVKIKESQKTCPFCHMETQEPPVLVYPEENRWRVMVIPNKFPAFSRGKTLNRHKIGPYQVMDGVGYHEVIVTRDHDRQIAQFSKEEVREVLEIYQGRYLSLMDKKFVNYISIFHNHGREAGASIYHPHSQLIAIPTIDPDLRRSLKGSQDFFRRTGKCVHCSTLEWDIKEGRRIIFENDDFVVFCPFAPRVAFEVRVYPKRHSSYFERIGEGEKDQLAEAMQVALSKLFKALKDPAYNFFIHTAPCDGRDHGHYHWHIEILPKTAVWAGFELSTGIEISTIEPEKAAAFLKKF